MSEPNTLPPDIHPTIALLPWYATGALSDADKADVSQHLKTCPSCRAELDELTRIGRRIKATAEAGPKPSAHLAQSIFTQVRQEAGRGRPSFQSSISPQTNLGPFTAIDTWLRSLFMPQWVPTLVTILLVAQLGLLAWHTSQPSRLSGTGADESSSITGRGLPTTTTRLRIEFTPTASMQNVQTLLAEVHGRLVDGPDSEGLYIMEVAASDSLSLDKNLQTLRIHGDIIQRVDKVAP